MFKGFTIHIDNCKKALTVMSLYLLMILLLEVFVGTPG